MTFPPITGLADVSLAEALWRLELLRSDDLPAVAVALLTSGIDTRSLRMLAATGKDASEETVALFTDVLRDLGKNRMSRKEAALFYAKWIASQILSNRLDPLKGAASIADAALRVNDETFHDLDPFVYAASESEYRPEDRPLFSKAVLAEASALVTRDKESIQPNGN
jgi:hypothetical protein